jgi:hypothetical protein
LEKVTAICLFKPLYGIHPDTGQPYHWIDESPETVRLAELPVATEQVARSIIAEAEALLLRAAGARAADPRQPADRRERTTAPVRTSLTDIPRIPGGSEPESSLRASWATQNRPPRPRQAVETAN